MCQKPGTEQIAALCRAFFCISSVAGEQSDDKIAAIIPSGKVCKLSLIHIWIAPLVVSMSSGRQWMLAAMTFALLVLMCRSWQFIRSALTLALLVIRFRFPAARSAASVSYTHLDVYKRQSLQRDAHHPLYYVDTLSFFYKPYGKIRVSYF